MVEVKSDGLFLCVYGHMPEHVRVGVLKAFFVLKTLGTIIRDIIGNRRLTDCSAREKLLSHESSQQNDKNTAPPLRK